MTDLKNNRDIKIVYNGGSFEQKGPYHFRTEESYRKIEDGYVSIGFDIQPEIVIENFEILGGSLQVKGNDCAVFWGSHGCSLEKNHKGTHKCSCCECPEGAHDGVTNPRIEKYKHVHVVCVGQAPYYGPDTKFYKELEWVERLLKQKLKKLHEYYMLNDLVLTMQKGDTIQFSNWQRKVTFDVKEIEDVKKAD